MNTDTGQSAEAIAPEASPAVDEKQGVKVETKKPEEPTPSAETPGDDATAEQPTNEEADEPKRIARNVQKSINRVTRQREEARARVAELERQLQAVQRPAVDEGGDTDPEPTRPEESKFTDWNEFEKAKEKFIVEKAKWATRQELRQAQRAAVTEHRSRENQERVSEARSRFEKRAAEVADKFEGLDDAIERAFAGDVPTSPAMAEYIMEVSDRGPELVFALDADPDLAARIAKMSPLAAVAALTRIEDKLPKPDARKVSGAPAPTKMVKGTAESPIKKLEEMSNAEYMAWARARDEKAGKLKQNIRR